MSAPKPKAQAFAESFIRSAAHDAQRTAQRLPELQTRAKHAARERIASAADYVIAARKRASMLAY